MENDCQKIREQILEFVSGTLPAEMIAELENHINRCTSCSRYLQAVQSDDQALGDLAESMQPTVAQLENKVIGVLKESQYRKTVRPTAWRTIIRSPVIKLAMAAVIIITIGLFVFHKRLVEQIDKTITPKAVRSPAELMTVASLNMAYRRGGMEAVEKQCEQALDMLRPQTEKISIKQLLAENNGT